MAVKKLIYKHLNALGFTKCGHTCVKRIEGSNCYGLVTVKRDKHPSYVDARKSIEFGKDCVVYPDSTFYDICCEVVYLTQELSPKELKTTFKDADIIYSLNNVQEHFKYEFFKSTDEDDEIVVSALLKFFRDWFYDPFYNNDGRSRLAHDNNVSLFTYLKCFYGHNTVAEFLNAETLCRQAFEETKYTDALYYAKMTMISFRPNEFDYNYALENFEELYKKIKSSDDVFLKGIINIYDLSAEKIFSVTK